jgi:hypothetical protein
MNPGNVIFWRDNDLIRFGYIKERVVRYTENDNTETLVVKDASGGVYQVSPTDCYEMYYETESLVKDIIQQLKMQYEPKLPVVNAKEGEVPF